MVNYNISIKRPFSDFGKAVLAIILALIPIVNFIYYGYLLEVARTAMKKKFVLPELKNFGTLFKRGFLLIVIGLIYSIPFILIFGFLVVYGAVASVNFTFVILLIAGIIGMIVYWPFVGAVMYRYAETYRFRKAFDFRIIAKKAYTAKFIGNLILSALITGVAAGVLGGIFSAVFGDMILLNYVFSMTIGFFTGVFYNTVMGQAYAEA